MKKNLSFFNLSKIFLAIMLIIAPLGLSYSRPVYAANVTAYIDLTEQAATAPSTISDVAEVATSTADEFYISYIPSATEFESADTIDIVLPTGFTSIATCTTPTTDADGDSTADGAVSVAGNTVTYTFSAATTQAYAAGSGTGVEICFAATTPSNAGNYSVSVNDTNDSDSSAAFIYVGDDNDVTVTANVAGNISLRIKEISTTNDTNTCDLGNLNPSAVNTCQYRIAAGTSLASGMKVYILADAKLNDGGGNDIDDITDDSADAGTEEYGITVNDNNGSGGTLTVTTPFHATNYEDIPATTDPDTREEILSSSGATADGDPSNWSTITHAASIDAGTSTGSYSQTVTYYAEANT